MSYAQTRIDRVRAFMREEGFDAFYLRDLSNIAWLTAFDGVFDDEPAHLLLITQEEAVLHTDSRYYQAAFAAAEGSSFEVVTRSSSHAAFALGRLASVPSEASVVVVSTPSSGASPLSLAIESSMTLGEYRALEKACEELGAHVRFPETQGVLLGLRAVKDAQERERMREAQAVTDAAFAHIVGFIQPGQTEREIQLELESFMMKQGAFCLAFSSIVATGAQGANPHAIPGEARLEEGHALVLDFGARARGYCSDMTRTVFIGQPDETMKRAYQTLRDANEAVAAMLRPGVTGRQAHELAEQILSDAGFAGKMGHSLGHGVGIDVHEEPVLALRNEQPLEEGNVVTVEPGIYIPGCFGMRLEDFGVVTDDGFEVFTQSSHDMVII